MADLEYLSSGVSLFIGECVGVSVNGGVGGYTMYWTLVVHLRAFHCLVLRGVPVHVYGTGEDGRVR